MNIVTVAEGKRGCGYRKPGGLYLRTDGLGRYCGALPVEVSVCPTCNHGIKPARGWTWINLAALVAVRGCNHEGGCCGDCPIADAKIQRVGLLWIGEKFYPTTRHFNNEATAMGLSRRITQIPRDFKLGETWIALAHRKAITNEDIAFVPPAVGVDAGFIHVTHKPGIFHVFMPTRIEYCVKADDSEEKLERMEKRGITLVKVVPQPEQQAA